MDQKREPEPAFGPDEEGEVPLRKRDIDHDSNKWVHVPPPAAQPGKAQ